jgi:enamine deaminase RidA (YjgF/YER057c/UK114 family)
VTRKVSSGSPWEPVVGYSRAVAAGDYVFVSGCTSIVDGVVVHEGDAYAQTVQAISNVRSGLRELGADLSDVVRTRMFVTDISRWREYGRAHGEAFGPPASGGVRFGEHSFGGAMSDGPLFGGAGSGAAGDAIMPATTMVGIVALIDPRMLVEVEAVAYRPGIGSAGPDPARADPARAPARDLREVLLEES